MAPFPHVGDSLVARIAHCTDSEVRKCLDTLYEHSNIFKMYK